MEERVVGKSPRGRRRLQILGDLHDYENNSYEVLKAQQKTEVHGEKARERK